MASSVESKTERIGLAVTTTELEALEFIFRIHGGKGGKYEGAANVVRDYSLTAAVDFHRNTKAALK